MQSPLVERVRAAYADRPHLAKLVDETTFNLLELTPPEEKVLAALLLHDGLVPFAYEEVQPMSDRLFASCLTSLEERRLIKGGGDQVTFEGAEDALKVRLEEVEGEPPSFKLVLRPLTERVMLLARRGSNPAAALGNVYAFVYGVVPSGKDFGLLGRLANLLGRDGAALLLLEFATERKSLHELIAIATARTKPNEQEETWARYQAALSRRG